MVSVMGSPGGADAGSCAILESTGALLKPA